VGEVKEMMGRLKDVGVGTMVSYRIRGGELVKTTEMEGGWREESFAGG
jgi:hypothetical protein